MGAIQGGGEKNRKENAEGFRDPSTAEELRP